LSAAALMAWVDSDSSACRRQSAMLHLWRCSATPGS